MSLAGRQQGAVEAVTLRDGALALAERGYHVFETLNTKPGITYLARVLHGEEA